MELKKAFYVACFFSLAFLVCWEIYWRSQGYIADIEDDKYLWAEQRAKVEKADSNVVVLIGSSRILFDIQLPIWEKIVGYKPIQLSAPGSTPLPAFRDLVENTTFSGTIIVGVTPGLFFSTTVPPARPWKRMQAKVDCYHNRTYAQRINHHLSIPLQNSFVILSKGEEEWADDIHLKAFLNRIYLGQRTERPRNPPFYEFMETSIDRNVRMKEKVVQDTAFANSIRRVWLGFSPKERKDDKEGTIKFFVENAKKFMTRGGNLILLYCPSDGELKQIELENLPRAEYWDELVKRSGAKSYHYEDYVELQGLNVPEWSHLAGEDADYFTKELLNILLMDQVIPDRKTQ
jgi:hypothetical protein